MVLINNQNKVCRRRIVGHAEASPLISKKKKKMYEQEQYELKQTH